MVFVLSNKVSLTVKNIYYLNMLGISNLHDEYDRKQEKSELKYWESAGGLKRINSCKIEIIYR